MPVIKALHLPNQKKWMDGKRLAEMKKPKLLLIGWDAADWKIIDPLMEQGKMPALKRLVENGVRANIATLNPVLSPMLWSSIATGKRSYDHGICGFVETDKVTGEISPVKSTSRKVKAVWNILNEAGFKTNVLNWWPSHPAESVDGVYVSNHFHKDVRTFGTDWPLDEASVFPEHWFEKLKNLRLHPAELTLAHVQPFIPNASNLDPEKDAVLKPFLRVLAQCSSIHNAATCVMEESEWDFMAVYHEAIDHFSHLAMKYHPPQLGGVSDEDFENYRGIVEGAYIFHDMMLERMLDLAGSDCNVMIVSDHGFESGNLRQVELPDVEAAPALEHRKYGVFIAAGPDFKKDQVYGASLLDVAPTILHHFGLPVAEDMEGRVLKDIFRKEEEVGSIPSWEITGVNPEFVVEKETSSDEMLKQLEDLGYIDLEQNDKLKYVDSELTYNLCVSYLDGNKPKQALPILKEYFEKNGELRFAMMLGQTYLKLGLTNELDQHLTILEEQFKGHGGVYFLRGLYWLQLNEHESALQHFLKMEELGLHSTQLWNEIARTFLIVQNYKAAQNYFEKTLAIEPENATALSGKAQCILELGNPEEAFMMAQASLKLQFFQPNTHYLVALAANALDKKEVAGQAVKVCLMQAPKHAAAKALWQKLSNAGNTAPQEFIIVVSGFPRSGTSLMMNMLSRGGLQVFTDGKREEDDSNPEGYFEHELVKKLGVQNDWIKEARGQALKVVSPLLRYLPATEAYKIIWVNRPLTEVLVSQEVMRGVPRQDVMKSFPFQKAVDMQKEEERIKKWLEIQPNIQLLEVDFYDCLHSTAQIISEIESFLGAKLDSAEAAKAINVKLHRNKLGNN